MGPFSIVGLVLIGVAVLIGILALTNGKREPRPPANLGAFIAILLAVGMLLVIRD